MPWRQSGEPRNTAPVIQYIYTFTCLKASGIARASQHAQASETGHLHEWVLPLLLLPKRIRSESEVCDLCQCAPGCTPHLHSQAALSTCRSQTMARSQTTSSRTRPRLRRRRPGQMPCCLQQNRWPSKHSLHLQMLPCMEAITWTNDHEHRSKKHGAMHNALSTSRSGKAFSKNEAPSWSAR